MCLYIKISTSFLSNIMNRIVDQFMDIFYCNLHNSAQCDIEVRQIDHEYYGNTAN